MISAERDEKITPHTARSASTPVVDPQSRHLYFTSDEGSEFAYLKRYELATAFCGGRENPGTSGHYFSRNGKYRVTIINQDARTVIKIYMPLPASLYPCRSCRWHHYGLDLCSQRDSHGFLSQRRPLASNLYVYDFATRKARSD